MCLLLPLLSKVRSILSTILKKCCTQIDPWWQIGFLILLHQTYITALLDESSNEDKPLNPTWVRITQILKLRNAEGQTARWMCHFAQTWTLEKSRSLNPRTDVALEQNRKRLDSVPTYVDVVDWRLLDKVLGCRRLSRKRSKDLCKNAIWFLELSHRHKPRYTAPQANSEHIL